VDPDAASYCVLRVCPAASAETFWSAVRAQSDVPHAIRVLLAGHIRVEVSRQEAAEALGWVAGISGWEGAEPKPLFLYDPRAGR
jgi:hypothetical protein